VQVKNKLLSAKLLPAKKGDGIKDGVKASAVANIFKSKVKVTVTKPKKAKVAVTKPKKE
jgi:hypothetical protein